MSTPPTPQLQLPPPKGHLRRRITWMENVEKMNNTSAMRLPMVVGLKKWYPYVDIKLVDGNRRLWGYLGSVVDTVLRTMNTSYVLKESAEYGYFMPNGTGVGLMRLLQTKEIDVIAVPFGLDMYLCAHFHCHPVVRVTDFRILTGMTNPYADNTFAISVGFDHYIWLLIGITLVSISILTVFMERTGIRSTARQMIDYLAPLVMQCKTQAWKGE